MLEIFLKTLPFFALIAVGFGAARSGFFSQTAAAHLTKFVFFFALSAMLFKFSANLSLAEIFDPALAAGYLWGTAGVWAVALIFAFWRRQDVATASVEAQCAAIGNTGFLGVPMLAVLFGERAVAPIILILAIDLIVFSSALTVLVTGSRGDRKGWAIGKSIGLGLVKNPMIVSIALGLTVSALNYPVPAVFNDFLSLLGDAATPGALFAIGASLAARSAERLEVALWLSFAKLALHPALVAVGVYLVFPTDPFKAGVAVAAAALPVAGNVYMLAQHYGVAPQRVSASILISTAFSIVTVSLVIGLVS